MIWKLPEPRFDVAAALDRGNRDYQEDSLISDFSVGEDVGIAVIADGMGGHTAGDLASKIVVTEVFSELKFHSDLFFEEVEKLPQVMTKAIVSANTCIRREMVENQAARGMGSTVVAAVLAGTRMFWTSIGDSPLYHFRDGEMSQVNEDHSMAPAIQAMVKSGDITAEEAAQHPDRNALTSAIAGGRIPRIDNRGIAMEVKTGDVIVVSSDGLQFLSDEAIAKTISKNKRKTSREIANALLQSVKKLNDPEQDNISFIVIKVNHEKDVIRPVRRGNVTEVDFNASRLTDDEESLDQVG